MRQKWGLLLIAGLLLVFFAPATAPRLSYGALFGSGQFQGEHASSGDGGVRRYATGTYNPAARRFGVNVYTLQYTNGIVNRNVVISFSNC
ncbi:MAG: hypothetical protein KJ064_21560 [Anaerolineae bacterium]|nr:hypothetical protein [Anaerolineae bacterium]